MLSIVPIALVFAFIGYLAVDLVLKLPSRGRGEGQTKWTLYLLCAVQGANFGASLIEWALRGTGTDGIWSLLGLGLIATKLILVRWSRSALGASYQVHAGTTRQHRLVEGGPYRFVRHPIYLGRYLGTLGIPLAFGAFYTLVVAAVADLCAILARIHFEERALLSEFGSEYEEYRSRRGALLPSQAVLRSAGGGKLSK